MFHPTQRNVNHVVRPTNRWRQQVSTGNKDIKPEDAAKQRQEIEAETKVRVLHSSRRRWGLGTMDDWLVVGFVDVCWVLAFSSG